MSLNSKHSEPRNVVLVTGSMQGGGAERGMSDMANYWVDRGWRVTLATWSGPEIADFYPLNPGVQRAWLNVYARDNSIVEKLRSNVSRVFRLRKLLSELNPDAVLSFIDTSNVKTILAATGLGMRVVVAERVHPGHNPGIAWQWKLLRKVLYARADAVVAQTRDAAHWIERNCRIRPHIIPNPLRLLPDLLNQRELFILAVGRLSKQKGFDLLLRAFAKICGDFDSWKVVIIGSGPEQSTLLKLCDELNITHRIDIREPVKDIESWMSRASLVVQPSRFEGFPNVVLEAMGMGAAVISANCPSGPSEIVQDGVNGRLVPVEDVDALAGAMADLLRQPGIRQQFGEEARKVRETFRQEKIMAQWEACVLSHQS